MQELAIRRKAMRSGQYAVSTSLCADKRFGRYKSEVAQPVRQADVTGTELERLRARREMLRSMTPEKALQVIGFHKGLNFFEALELAKREGKLIVPNDVHDRILNETKDEGYFKENYPVWTGTLVIYEKPDKPFGKKVNFGWRDDNSLKYSISFQVPEQFRGKTNCALIVEHPDFERVDLGNNKFEIRATDEFHLIEHFPKKSGLYMPDAETKIPHGRKVKESSDAGYLLRSHKAYLGSLVRDHIYWNDDYGRRYVHTDLVWSYDSGVAFF